MEASALQKPSNPHRRNASTPTRREAADAVGATVSGFGTQQALGHGPAMSLSSGEVSRRKSVELTKWHVKFDGSCKELTVESFIFRIEKRRKQYELSFDQFFSDFHCMVTGAAVKLYWGVLEDHESDPDFGSEDLKRELLSNFRSADYEIIKD